MIEGETIAGRVVLTFAEGVVEVRLNRPDKLNALDPAMFEALVEAGERLKRLLGCARPCSTARAAAFRRASTWGASPRSPPGGVTGSSPTLPRAPTGSPIWRKPAAFVWREVPVPVIAAVHGVAFGGGFQIALGADIRYVAPDAKLSILEIKWGLVPDMGGVALMRELARGDVIRELAFTGRQFSGEEAVRYGFGTAAPRRAARRRRGEPRARSRKRAPTRCAR